MGSPFGAGNSDSKTSSTSYTGGTVTGDNGGLAVSTTGNRNTNILPGATQNTKSGNSTIKIGKGATYNVTQTGLDPATLAQLNSQANLRTSERAISPVTGLPVPEEAQSPFNSQNLLIGLVATVLGLVAIVLTVRLTK